MPSYIKQVNWTGQNPGDGSNYSWIDVNGATTQGWVTLNELGSDSWEFVIAENATGSTRTATFKVQHWTWEQGTNDQDLSDEFTITQYSAPQSGGNPTTAAPTTLSTFTYDDWTGSVSVNADGTVSIQPGNAQTVITNPASVSANTTPGTEQVSMNVTVTVPAGYANTNSTVSDTITLTQPTSYSAPGGVTTNFFLSVNDPSNGVVVQNALGQNTNGATPDTSVLGTNLTFDLYLVTDETKQFTNVNQAEIVLDTYSDSNTGGPGGWGGGQNAQYTKELLPDGRIKVTATITTADPMLDPEYPAGNIYIVLAANVSPVDVEIPTYSAFTMINPNGLQGTTITSPDDNGSNWNNYTFDSSGHVEGEEVTHVFLFRATDWSSQPGQGTNFESVDDIDVVTTGNTPAGAVTITKELLAGPNGDEQMIRVTVVRNMTADGWTTTLQASGAPVSQVPETSTFKLELHTDNLNNAAPAGGAWTAENVYTFTNNNVTENNSSVVTIIINPLAGYQFTDPSQVQLNAINGTDSSGLQFVMLLPDTGGIAYTYTQTIMPPNDLTVAFQVETNPVAIVNPEYNAFTRTPAVADEGNAVTFTLTSTDIPQGTTIAATVSGVGAADFSNDDLSWSFEIGANGQATKTINIAQDSSTEGNETATVTLAATDSAGNQVFSSAGDRTLTFSINDTSTDDILEFTNTDLQLLLWNDGGNNTRVFSMNRDDAATYTWSLNTAGAAAQPGQIYFSNSSNGSPVAKPAWIDVASASGDNSGGTLTYSVTEWPWTDDSNGSTSVDPNNLNESAG